MFHRQPAAAYCICVGVGLLGVLGSMMTFFMDAEESIGLQVLYLLRGPQSPPEGVVLVAIDAESANALDLPLAPTKWPRLLHSRLLERLVAGEAAVIAFDLFFNEPQEAVSDQRFSSAMRQAGNVILTQAIDRQTMPLTDRQKNRTAHLNIERIISSIPLLANAASAQAPFPLPTVPIKLNQFWCFRSASGNTPTMPVVAFHIYARSAFADFIHLLSETDASIAGDLPIPESGVYDVQTVVGMIRSLHALFEKKPSLAARALKNLESRSTSGITGHHETMIRALIDLYRQGSSRYLNLYGPAGTINTISYHRLITEPSAGGDDGHLLFPKAAAIFVGQTGSSWIKTHDGFHTAFSGKSGKDISGVEIAATAFANLMEQKVVAPLAPSMTLVLLFGWGMLLGFICLHFFSILSATGLVIANVCYVGVAYWQFNTSGTWLPLIVPILVQSPSAYIAGLLWKHRQATIDRRNIREAFGHYLPDDVVDRLSANIKELQLGGQVFYGICLFTDAQNYTTLSETLNPDHLTALMNRYYEAIFEPIKANGGLVLQVVGDSILAIWTAREPQRALKHAACQAAIGITESVNRFNRREGSHAMPTRIGIHAGEILLGNIGAEGHFEYRPVGDIVNTASRLEGLNKYLKTSMLISNEIIGPDNGFTTRKVGRFVFKGKSRPVQVFELLPPHKLTQERQAEVCRIFNSALEAFQHRRWEVAEALFNQVLILDRNDGPSQFYLECCRAYRSLPLDQDWDGSVRLEKK